MIKKMYKKAKEFIVREDGSELMQWAIIIIIVAGLIGVAYAIGTSLTSKLNEAANVIDGTFPT